jgi:sporulation protein YlmC with PRC-barrel domain
MATLPIHLLSLEEGEVALADDEDDVRGFVVLDANGHRVGEVNDVMVDDDQWRARLLVVASGGVLGLGAHRHLMPVDAVARVTDRVRLQHSADMVQQYDADALSDPADYAAVYSHYGYTPFWDPAHTGSYFHDRRW